MDERDPLTSDPQLRDLIDGQLTVAASRDALQEIVARRDRWRVRSLAVALAVAVVALPIIGYAVGHSQSGSTVVAGASRPVAPQPVQSSNAPSTGASVAGGYPTISEAKPEQLFLRDTGDGVRIRGYLTQLAALPLPKCAIESGPAASSSSQGGAATGTATASSATAGPAMVSPPSPVPPSPGCPAPPTPACQPGGLLGAQVSDDQVAGQAISPGFGTATDAVDVLTTQVVGASDPTPIGTVLLRTAPNVTRVTLHFEGGPTDQMSPVKGYAILAGQVAGLAIAPTPTPTPPQPEPPLPAQPAPGPATNAVRPAIKAIGFGFPKATIEAFDSSGKTVGHIDLPALTSFGAFGCGVSLPAQPVTQPSHG